MKAKYKDIVDKEEKLLIILDDKENIIFETNASPVSTFIKKIFIDNSIIGKLRIYTNQLGIGLVELSNILEVEYYYGTDISIPAKEKLEMKNIKFEYKNIVQLVHSSKDNTKTCPIEKKLSELNSTEERLDFLREEAKKAKNSCKIKLK